MSFIIDLFLHLDVHLNAIVNQYGLLSYAMLFAVIFIETGAVVLPFLPGDSLLFAAGAISAIQGNVLNHWWLLLLFWVAAFAGDNLNFFLGRTVGLKIVRHPIVGRFVKEKYLEDTNQFFEKHGALAIVFARFMPIIRTFAPFTAAISGFSHRRFAILEAIAVTIWSFVGVEAGYYFGRIPFIQEHFTLVIFGILFVTALPAIITGIRQTLISRKEKQMDKSSD
jgi:membrane-associated protein